MRNLLALLFMAFTTPALAIPTMQPPLRDHEIRVGLQGNVYLTPSSETTPDAGTGHGDLKIGVRGVGDRNDLHAAVEAESLLGLRRVAYHYLDVGELYVGFEKKSEKSRPFAYLGRKRFEWNALDSYWSLGLYEPRFRWDYLNERENGLFGLFLGWKSEAVEVFGYVSPIFIPEQGAPFDITGGNCHSSSPWFSCPASTISIFNQPTNVNFQLDVPPVKNLIVHEGHGGSVRLGRAEGPFARASFAHKPMNQFVLAFEGRLDLANNSVPAIIRPRVLYQNLWGLDVGYKDSRSSLTASALLERPIRDVTPPTWNTQEVSDAKLFGITGVAHPIAIMKQTRIEASWFHREGGIENDRGPFVSPGSSYFEPRYSFQNAFSIAGFTPFYDEWARKLLVSAKFIVDTAYTGNLLVADVFYSPTPRLVLDLGADVIGSNNPLPIDFLSRYQRNDRIRVGATYSF